VSKADSVRYQVLTRNLDSIFKDDASKAVIDAEVIQVEKEGGTITQRYDSSIMRGFAAILPEEMAQSYASLTEGGKHDFM
jgi:hypothetical protein